MLNYLTNPDTLFGKLLSLSFIRRTILLALLVIVGWAYTIFQISQQYQQIRQIGVELTEQTQHLQHKQQILASLKQHMAQSALTPILTNKVVKINQYIQQYSDKIILHSTEWAFHSFPQLNLQFQSYFADFQQFLTALLLQYPQLRLNKLQLVKSEHVEGGSIQADILLQLQPIEE
ncbi:hypothetical protein [Pasteurella oralis]|uniref:hypothetical protein n=1 Tax=Pasteurella oralis TaxID=1071947 RepID=UPI000C7D1B39|nr:hypothetical protein [Pasteurella oralis]